MKINNLTYYTWLFLALSVFGLAQTTRIDHVLIAVNNLDSAKYQYEQYGFKVVYGGSEKKALNALIFLKDGTLIELVGKDRFPKSYTLLSSLGITRLSGLVKDRIAKFRKAPEGLFNYCLYTSNLDSTYTFLKKNNIKCNKQTDLKRKREDGITTQWSLVGTKPYDLPFYISDYTPPRMSDSSLTDHSNGARGIDSLEILTSNFDLYVKVYNNLYNQITYASGAPGSRKAKYSLPGQSIILSETTVAFVPFRKKEQSVPVKAYLRNKNNIKKELNKYLHL